MINIFKYKLTLKIFISFLCIIIIPALISLFISYRLIKSTLDREINIRLQDSISGFNQELINIEESCLKIAKELSRNDEIKQLFVGKNYDSLERKLIDIYRMGFIDVIEIEDTTGKVILRGHNPELSGDIKLDQSIIQLGLSGRSVIGYEKGKSGFAIRAVAPLNYDNRIVGLIMAGSSFSHNFVNHIKLLTGMENGIYKDNSKIISTFKEYNYIDKDVVNKLKQRQIVFLNDIHLNNESYYLILKPLFLDNNLYWGSLVMGFSKREGNRYLSYVKIILALMIAMGIFIALLIFLLLAKNINYSLREIISGINNIDLNRFDTRITLKSKDEFGMVAQSFNSMMKKLYLYTERIKKLREDMIKSVKLATTGQIATGLAHEIRNPLSSIKMMMQIVRDRYLKENNCKEINTILIEINRINNILKNLLEFSKPSPMHFIKQDINEIVVSSIDIYKYNIKHQNISLCVSLDSDLPQVHVDGEKMKSVLINIIINSIQAMPDGGKLSIETNREKKGVIIKIHDTGGGIDGNHLKTIFEPFYTTKNEGTGLGLSLAKAIVERHNGRIKVKSGKNGTCFTIYIPVFSSETNYII